VLRLRCYIRANIGSESAISLQRGQFDPEFQVEGVAPTNHSSSKKTRLNVLSYGIKNLDRSFFRFVKIHAFVDRRTNSFFIYRVCVPCSAIKTKFITDGYRRRSCKPTTENIDRFVRFVIYGFCRATAMQGSLSDERNVCPSVCLSNTWTVIKRKKLLSKFLYRRKGQFNDRKMFGEGRLIVCEIINQTNHVRSNTPIFSRFSFVAPEP